MYELNELVNNKNIIGDNAVDAKVVGLFNKDGSNRLQINITPRGQTGKECEWIKKKVEDNEIPEEVAQHLGARALFKMLDMFSLEHIEEFLKKDMKEKALELMREVQAELNMLGTDPKELDRKKLKDYIKVKVAQERDSAQEGIAQMARDLWDKAVEVQLSPNDDGRELKLAEKNKLAKETFAGGTFVHNVEEKLLAAVKKAFDGDKNGPGMLISRLDNLRKIYLEETEDVLRKNEQGFKSSMEDILRMWRMMISMKSKILRVFAALFLHPLLF